MKVQNTESKSSNAAEEACPNDETLGLFVEQALNPENMEEVALHLLSCLECKRKTKDMTEWIVGGRTLNIEDATAEERHVVDSAYKASQPVYNSNLWQRFFEVIQPTHVYSAAADGQTADQIHQEAALRSGFIHFASKTPRGHKDAWHVKLAIPLVVNDETYLRLQVFDCNEDPMPEGILTFCGVDLEVKSGRARMSIKAFRENIGRAVIAFRHAGGSPIPGEPLRAYDLGI